MPRLEIPMKTAEEHDALSSRAKRLFNWPAGLRTLIKRSYNKRVRREEKLQIKLSEVAKTSER